MQEDVEPWAQPSLLSPPCPSFPPVACGGCLPSALPVFCSFALFMLIYLFILLLRQCLSCLGEPWGGGSLAFGGALGWCCIPGALSPSCTPAPLPPGSEAPQGAGMGRGPWLWPAVPSCPGSQVP